MNNDNYQADCHFPVYRHFSSPVFRGTEREKEREGATLFLSSHTLAYTQQHTHFDSNTEAVLCVCVTHKIGRIQLKIFTMHPIVIPQAALHHTHTTTAPNPEENITHTHTHTWAPAKHTGPPCSACSRT